LEHVPVIIISADATHGRIERLMGMGVLDYLPKPLDIKKFLHLLDTCLNGTEHSK
jgi:response regulator of citrate/malate metabolism